MAAKTKVSPNGNAPIDFSTLMPSQRRYEKFTMDQGEDESADPFWVRVQRLTPAEVETIPTDNTPIADILVDKQAWIVGWSLTAVTDAGDVVPVPPPAELEPDSFRAVLKHLVLKDQATWMYQVLRAGDMLKLISEKKALIKSATSLESSPEDSSEDAT